MSEIIDALNKYQQEPATTVSGAVIVIAGAGSGKTRLLTHRIAHIVKDLGVPSFKILAITFTNKATNEMRERLSVMIPNTNDMKIFTFHAMCSYILRQNIERIGFNSNFTIYGDTEKNRIIKRFLPADEKSVSEVNSISWHISNAKNQLLSPLEYLHQIKFDKKSDFICDIYAKYQNELKLSNALDFDDLLFKTYELFKSNSDILEKYSRRFEYIHVDEFQDTNYAQYELVKMLSYYHKNLFVVGDEDQCIYSWRGANFTNINKIKKDFENVKLFKLEQNYRSQKHILEKANQIIKNNTERNEKVLWTDKPGGEEVQYFTAYNDLEEAEKIAQKIKSLVSEGYQYKDFCILMRINALSKAIEEKFLNYQIPHQIFGGFKFFERKEVKDVLAYLKIISNPFDNDSFVRVLAYPKKGIGDTTISKILDKSQELNISAYDLIKGNYDFKTKIITKVKPVIDLIDYFRELKNTVSLSELCEIIIRDCSLLIHGANLKEEDISKNKNIEALAVSVSEFEKVNPDSGLDDFLQSITLSRDIDNLDDKENYVTIMTVHSAKGLEFKIVFVIGLCEGLFPLSRAINAGGNELEEERRLMYVATTRAEEILFYSRPITRFVFESKRTETTMPSRFLKEAGFVELSRIQTESNSNNQNRSRVSFYDDDKDDFQISSPKVSKEVIDNYSKFKRGSIVTHPSFGQGEVVVEVTDPIGAFITVRFENVGIKTLSLKFAPLKIVQ